MSNFIPVAALRSATVAVPWISPEVEAAAGDIVHFGLLLESLGGAPSAASLALKFQVCPIESNGLNINSETNAVGLPWIDVVAGDGLTGHMLLDGAFPTTLADNTYPRTSTGASAVYPSGTRLVERRLLVGALGKLVRVVATPTFTGGTSPSWTLTAAFAIQPHFGA